MRGRVFLLLFLALGLVQTAAAQEAAGLAVDICFNYGCLSQWTIELDAARVDGIVLALQGAQNAAEERAHLALAIGQLYALAAEQTPIGNDKGGNYADAGVYGRMDCIDHSRTTTGFLKLLEARGALRWHRVLAPARRVRGLIFQHYSAAIETRQPATPGAPPESYVVDSWFVDNGKPAVILPLDAWMEGEGPDVE